MMAWTRGTETFILCFTCSLTLTRDALSIATLSLSISATSRLTASSVRFCLCSLASFLLKINGSFRCCLTRRQTRAGLVLYSHATSSCRAKSRVTAWMIFAYSWMEISRKARFLRLFGTITSSRWSSFNSFSAMPAGFSAFLESFSPQRLL